MSSLASTGPAHVWYTDIHLKTTNKQTTKQTKTKIKKIKSQNYFKSLKIFLNEVNSFLMLHHHHCMTVLYNLYGSLFS